MLLLVAFGLMAMGPRANAQGFGLAAAVSTNTVIGTNAVTYAIIVTNNTGFGLNDVLVTNTFSGSVSVLTSTNSQGTNFIISPSFIFDLGGMTNGATAVLSLSIQASSIGFLTNMIEVATTDGTNTATTNLVTDTFTSQSDLAVGFVPPVQAVITNDVISYTLIVSNLGPDAATNVVVTNTLPTGVILNGATLGYTLSSSNLIFSLGTLASGSNDTIQVSIEPTNVGILPFSVSVGVPDGVDDPNLTNNTLNTNLSVISYLPGILVALTNAPQSTNFENGLTEQSITLMNTGTTNVPAVRLVVTGLTNQLFNAVGTNNGSPFVYYSAPLAVGQSASLLLRYNPWGKFPFTNGQLHAFAVPLPNWTPPAALSSSANINIQRILKLPNGTVILEFPSTLGRAYTVVYSDNVLFSNAMIAPPVVVAPANETLWIDYGPPGTTNAPFSAAARFYRVQLNP
jgi:uncharacterized repeat protein (TIGR01451 family)